MSGVNKVILVGRLGKEPEIRNLENGAMVANFSIATSEVYKDRTTGERRESTEWHNIALWRGLAEIAQKYLHKGDMVYIEGKLKTRSWEKDGITRYTTEIVGENLTMLSGKPGGGANNSSGGTEYTSSEKGGAGNFGGSAPVENSIDDLPF